MNYYRATRSFYGDLGSIRRNERIPLTDARLTGRDRAVKELLQRGLLVKLSGDDDEGLSATRKSPKAPRKPKEKENEAT